MSTDNGSPRQTSTGYGSMKRSRDGCASTDHVIDDNRTAATNVAYDAVCLDLLSANPRFVYDCHRQIQGFSVASSEFDCSKIGRENDRFWRHSRSDSIGEQRHRAQMFQRNAKKSLQRCRVEVYRDNPFDARALDKVGDQTRSDRITASCASVLSRIAKIGDECSESCRACTPARVREKQ